MQPTTTIRQRLEDYIKEKGLSLHQFSDISGVNAGTLSGLINHRRRMSILQLDRISMGMGLAEGSLYELYIEECLAESSPDWRRLKSLLQRCAELDKLDCIQRIILVTMDNLAYAPHVFDLAEQWYRAGRIEAAAVLYRCVAEGEKYQHSERLALCQYRLFTIHLGSDREVNLSLAASFEPYVERLGEAEQLEALKDLADTYAANQRWTRVEQLAQEMESKAAIQYRLSLSTKEGNGNPESSQEKTGRPILFYILYGYLLRANVCEARGDYEQALDYVSLYTDLSWVQSCDETERIMIEQFEDWGRANACLYRLMSGEAEVLPEYVNYVASHDGERVSGLLKITEAANRYHFRVDDILERFGPQLKFEGREHAFGNYDAGIAAGQHTRLLSELAAYYLSTERVETGLGYIIDCLEACAAFYSEVVFLQCVGLFETYRGWATPERKRQYTNLISEVQRNHEEKKGFAAKYA
ncbi:helix-turn-helix domain-containing protein [Paenibacillus lentus]|uniref:XRE family transcriptional regulator n=1 Tax=Paenibacillus lentus TaxID=1338368 RepID=A0A3S8RRV3_9BACL|nr:helix-turn-helix transcriptional regulator [Paenibacillus lentus]AZK45701.1 XRE family transcriptional regulator [Paenibacillus lentus]